MNESRLGYILGSGGILGSVVKVHSDIHIPASHASMADPIFLNLSPSSAAPDDTVFSTRAYSHLPEK